MSAPEFEAEPSPIDGIIAESPAMKHALRQARRYTTTSLPILVSGATGTGKEIIARYLHWLRGEHLPYIDLNCAAFPRDMIESLLFGHRKGTFTGAYSDRQGLIEAAHGGTLYLDELCSLSLEGQGKLLRVMETKRNRRLGDAQSRPVSFTLIASVQHNPKELVAAKRLREDLYYRLSVCRIHLTPLRERPEDLTPLAELFAARYGKRLAPGAARALRDRAWEGNARDVFGAITRAALMSDEAVISREELEAAADDNGGLQAADDGGSPERRELLRLYIEHKGDTRAMAEALRVSRATVYRQLERHRIGPRRKGMGHGRQGEAGGGDGV